MSHPRRRKADHNFWTQTGVIPRWQLVAVYALIVAAGAVGLARTQSIAHRADHLSQEIQQQRVDSTRAICESQNARNIAIVRTLTHSLKVPLDVARQVAGATAPLQDCDKVVRQVTGRK